LNELKEIIQLVIEKNNKDMEELKKYDNSIKEKK
jgi:hypothetical protein